MEEDILVRIYWYNTCSCFQSEHDSEKWLLERLHPSTEVYGVLWVSDANIPYREKRLDVIAATKLTVPESGKRGVVKEIENLCKIQHSGCSVYFANAMIVNSEDLESIVKDIENKPKRGNPKLFGKKIDSWENLKAH